jgi:transcriptional regulator with XRE-family HTH domain
MATSRKTTGRRRTVKARGTDKETATPPQAEESTLVGLAHQVRSWTDSVLGIAGAAADVSLGAARSMLPKPEQRRALAKAGAVLRGMRETAGLSLRQVGEAINMKDPTLLDLVENGKVALPFEVILRLASVLGRNDPVSFVMRFTRSYNPEVWQTLENLGIGRIALQAGREHEFVNLYRGSDAARRLSDEEFAHALAFTKAAFDMAVAFKSPGKGTAPKAKGTAERK